MHFAAATSPAFDLGDFLGSLGEICKVKHIRTHLQGKYETWRLD
jgi:hypothetical protein